MALQDIFKSGKTREEERKKLQRQAKRKVEKATLQASERINFLAKERDNLRKAAYDLLKSGKKLQAESKMKELRFYECVIDQMEKKKWLYTCYLVKIENAEADDTFADAMLDIVKVIRIDPVKIEGALNAIGTKLEEQTDIDSIFESLYKEETDRASVKVPDSIPSLSDMMKELESEVALEVGGKMVGGSNTQADVTSAREELAKLREQGDRS